MGNVRDAVIENVIKFLACGTSAFGSRRCHCDKPGCSHEKYLHQTCKSRACPIPSGRCSSITAGSSTTCLPAQPTFSLSGPRISISVLCTPTYGRPNSDIFYYNVT
ncbi:hypothetical protein AT251_24015 [Enterovibrio nigricans]|nr:hypothetical protein AT251_24015 [Enterovibrio nigricans]